MKEENRVVNALWIGPRLSLLETLTVSSFIDKGHNFRLWLYGPIENELHPDVQIMDANEIIPENKIFRYKNSNQFGHGKGSVSGFSDIFRYKLLYDHGGWWVDMDVTCLKSLDVESEYYFRPHHELTLVGNVMKCPKGSDLMLKCFTEASEQVDENNTDWHKPIDILVNNVKHFGLNKFITEGFSIVDRWDLIRQFLYSSKEPDQAWCFMHWMNEEWRSRGLDKYDFMINSLYGRKLIEHGIIQDDFAAFNRAKNSVRFAVKRTFS